jgi:proline iminopeptidase
MVLHGGPGVPDLAANQRAFEPFTEFGADVYLYTQLGTGASSRLSDPRGYSRQRDAADLEALRQALGLERVVLIGHSYGGALAAQYLTEHPDRVAALILVSPAPLDPSDHSGDRLTLRLSTSERMHIYRSLALPRALTAYALLQINPRAAHSYFPDAEADFRNDMVVQGAAPALHCTGSRTNEPVRGTGFYAAQYPQSATMNEQLDVRSRMAGIPVPTLILKGSCDYLSWSSVLDYRNYLPNSSLLYFPDTGHNLHQDKPEIVRDTIVSFLDQKATQVPNYRGSAVPPGYQGPA